MSDAAAEPTTAPAPTIGQGRVGVAGMWTFLATDAMGFGGLFIAYAVLRVRADHWPGPRAHLALRPAAALTFLLLASALTVAQATRAGSARARRGWVGATAALGLAFLVGEIAEFVRLAGTESVRFGSDLFGATFYVLTGYHALHVAAGIVVLLLVLARGARPRALEVAALYWQFVDLVWMPIFTFVYLMPAR